MKQEHHPKDIRTNSRGATHDIDREITGSENQGTYFDSENGRVSSDRGNKDSWEKIRGEQLNHNVLPSGDWFSLCSISVNDDTFEVWVEESAAEDPRIIINGQVMGTSPDMPWLFENRIQFDKNEACIGGEVFLTDYNVAPMIFNVGDIKDAFDNGDQTYFDDFNPNLYFINLESPLDIPIFRGLVNLGGGGGLPVSSNQYSIRYVNEDGDATNWSQLTPTIPVVQSLSTGSGQYPGVKTYGGPSSPQNPTAYGVRLRFRVTNVNDYDFIELRRISYEANAGLDAVPQGNIIARIAIESGEISFRDFIDPIDANVDGELATGEQGDQVGAIERAKAIRYYDKRLVLMNYDTPSLTSDLNFIEYNGEKILPVVESLGKQGFNDPVNHTYFKNYQSNERYSFAVNLFDGVGGSGFTVEDDDLKNIQAPSRRDVMTQDSVDLSTGNVTAANVDSTVGDTFEVFDHENAVVKTDTCSFKNILDVGSKTSGNVNEFCPDAGFGGIVQSSEIGYQPYRPTDASDATQGHNYRVNPEVSDSNLTAQYNPKGFGCDYYSRGFALGGISNLPSWAKSFSVVRSERAGRVICQGIGMYSLNQGDFNVIGGEAATKELNKFWFASPDITSGIVNQGTLDDINANPQNYRIQFVSPLGFFSEVYNFESNFETSNRDRLIDMVTYARVLRDNGQINPNESPSMGLSGYVAYNRYRNLSNPAGSGAFNDPQAGNKTFDLSGFNFVTDGRSNYYEIVVNQNIYNVANTGGFGNNDFDDQGMRDFTEPFYIINILRVGAEVPDLNINSYRSTGHYQKVESIIGVGDSTPNQSFVLIDERWEDCIPSLTSTGFNNDGESFVYLIDDQQNESVCLNVTYNTPAEVNTIVSDISSNGFHVTPGGVTIHGIYTHSQDSNGDIFINFNNPITTPFQNQRIIVRYDNTRPIRFFGGDTVVGENTFCPIDKEADGSQGEVGNQFTFNIGFPYRRFKLNPRHYVVRNTTGINRIQNEDNLRLGYLRQMIVMYAAESRAASQFSFNGQFPLEFFPLTHYIMRPNRFDDSSFASGVIDDIVDDNNMQADYFEDYPTEYNLWRYGGFRFMQQFNVDYSVKGPILFFSRPDVGFEEQNSFCTGIAWSLPRAINQQNSPGLRTFPSSNRFLASDDNGEIKKAYDSRTGGKGDNLYSINETGVCLYLTRKAILSNIDSNDLTTTSSDQFIGGEYWLSREIGSNDEMWRGMAEASVEFRTDAGTIERETLYFPNSHSVYRLTENVITDLTKEKYYSRINPSLKVIRPGYLDHLTGTYDKNHNEYWLQIKDQDTLNDPQRCFVFDQNEHMWIGRFHYSFDNYVYHNNEMYGHRDGMRYILDRGFRINGQPIEAKLIQHTSVNIANEKEFISIEVNTGPRGEMKPTELVFMDENMVELCRLNEATQGPLYLKQYDGWWNFIPRKETAVSSSRDRVQYRLILFEINHIFEEDFKVVSSVIQYKPIK